MNEAIRDQIIEKCRDPKLRRKFLEKSSEATLTVLQETARVHEAVNTQMQSMERPKQVNKLSPNDRQVKEKGTKGKKPRKERKCYVCGGNGHLTQDKSPALDKTSNKCGKSGHFAACCKKKSTKKPSGRHRSEGANKVSEEKEGEDNYALVLDTKSSNGSSFVVDWGDMRRVNEAIERERHPIPTIEEVLHDLNGSTVFSKLDLKWGFHQVELETESRRITAFITHRGLFQYKRLMFGITSAPDKYQKIVKDVLIGCKGVANIADDLIIYRCGIKEHGENLLAVLCRLKERGSTQNEKKCQFRLPKLTFLGHDLSSKGIAPSEEKVSAVQNAKPPQSTAGVRSFLGLVQYCAKFLPDCSQVAEPLRMLTRKDLQFMWEDAQHKSFQKLKDLLTRVETLTYFKNERRTRIVADAGPTGIGAVLTQLQDGLWRVISYASRNLTDVERQIKKALP